MWYRWKRHKKNDKVAGNRDRHCGRLKFCSISLGFLNKNYQIKTTFFVRVPVPTPCLPMTTAIGDGSRHSSDPSIYPSFTPKSFIHSSLICGLSTG